MTALLASMVTFWLAVIPVRCHLQRMRRLRGRGGSLSAVLNDLLSRDIPVGRRDSLKDQVLMDVKPLDPGAPDSRSLGVFDRDIELPADVQPGAPIQGKIARFQRDTDNSILYRGARLLWRLQQSRIG